MDVDTLVLLVKNMRDAQKTYFRDRQPSKLNESKDWERRVDVALKAILEPETNGLFDGSNAGEGK